MPRSVAFLRGVSPTNAKMPGLARAFEKAGFTAVRTVLSSGNVVFESRRAPDSALERRAEAREVFSMYVPSPRGPEFMVLIEKTFGVQVATRTLDTVRKRVAASNAAAKPSPSRRKPSP